MSIVFQVSKVLKKELISTWEVEPKLAVITGFSKTDKTAKNLIESSLMKNIPHLVLYINKETNHALLLDKQEVVKTYTLKEEK
jgi:hypothetical protein